MRNFEFALPLYIDSFSLQLQVWQPFYGEFRIKQSFISHSDRDLSACGIYSDMIDNG